MNAAVNTKVMDWAKYTLDEWLSQYGAFISINRMRFLNGVCRHEPMLSMSRIFASFLNGVCRHEQ